jgi:hypothetical protein
VGRSSPLRGCEGFALLEPKGFACFWHGFDATRSDAFSGAVLVLLIAIFASVARERGEESIKAKGENLA